MSLRALANCHEANCANNSRNSRSPIIFTECCAKNLSVSWQWLRNLAVFIWKSELFSIDGYWAQTLAWRGYLHATCLLWSNRLKHTLHDRVVYWSWIRPCSNCCQRVLVGHVRGAFRNGTVLDSVVRRSIAWLLSHASNWFPSFLCNRDHLTIHECLVRSFYLASIGLSKNCHQAISIFQSHVRCRLDSCPYRFTHLATSLSPHHFTNRLSKDPHILILFC